MSWPDSVEAVVKLARPFPDGRVSFRELPTESYPRREVAFWRLSRAFGWDSLVPETVLFSYAGVEASAQRFVPGTVQPRQIDSRLDSRERSSWVAGLERVASLASVDSWLRIILLDVVAGSRDRHVNNVGLTSGGEVVAWDNSVSFGTTFRLYHNSFHRYLFPETFFFASSWRAFSALSRADLVAALSGLVSSEEIEHAWVRHQFLCDFPYRAPWNILSEGAKRRVDFAAREDLFRAKKDHLDALRENLLYIAAVGS